MALPDPRPGPGQVRIAVRAAGVNASDWKTEPVAYGEGLVERVRALGGVDLALHVLAEIGELVESGRFSLPAVRTFPLTEVAEAHRVGEDGHVRGKLVLVVD